MLKEIICRLLIAAGHNGTCYALKKTANYDKVNSMGLIPKLKDDLESIKNDCKELSDYEYLREIVKCIQGCIDSMKQFGVNFYVW